MNSTLPLQAADMLAWTIGRNHSLKVDLRQYERTTKNNFLVVSAVCSIIMIKHGSKIIDYNYIVQLPEFHSGVRS